MEYRNFEEDLNKSNSNSLKSKWEQILKKIFGCDSIIDFRDNCKTTQLKFGTDVLVQQKKGRKFSVELKTRNYKYYEREEYVLEIKHHIYSDQKLENKVKSKEGWLYCSTADYIIYGTLNDKENDIIEVCGFSLIPFKLEEFKQEISKLNIKFANTKFSNGQYQTTIIKLAPIDFLKNNAQKFWYFKMDGGLNDFF